MQFKFLILFFVGALVVDSAPIANTTNGLRQPINKLGVIDFLTMIPGVHTNEVCSMCKKILGAVKKDTIGRANFQQNDLRAVVDYECHQLLTQNAIPYLPLESLEPFCREFGGTIMDYTSTYANMLAGFIEPAYHCEVATLCPSSDE